MTLRLTRSTKGLGEIAAESNYVYAYVDSAFAKVHMIDQVFFAVARQIDWEAMSESFLRRIYAQAAFPIPDGSQDLTVAAVARHYDYDQGELNRTLNQQLQKELLKDFRMTQEFRVAMMRLCQSKLIDNNAAAN